MNRPRLVPWLVTAALIGGLVVGPVGSALADDELDRYLAEAAAADYSGTEVVVTTWGGDRFATVVEMEKTGSTMVIRSGGGTVTVVGDGIAHDAAGTMRLSAWSTMGPSDRYEVTGVREVIALGRRALEVVVGEDRVRRAVIVIDEETRAALSTRVLNPDGTVFRESAFTSFGAGPGDVADIEAGPAYTMMIQTPDSDMPDDLAGYRLTDGYGDDDGVSQAYFSDGLFSFSVFDLGESAQLADIDDVVVHEVDGHPYRVVVEPSRIMVTWEADSEVYLLVGDLPPDHLDQVLRQLPAPGSDGLFGRIWQSIFG